MKKKITISMPLDNDELFNEIDLKKDKARIKLNNIGYEVIDSLFSYDKMVGKSLSEQGIINSSLYFLSHSLENMSKCDAIYFFKGWNDSKKCTVEHNAAELYGLEIIYEEENNDDTSVLREIFAPAIYKDPDGKIYSTIGFSLPKTFDFDELGNISLKNVRSAKDGALIVCYEDFSSEKYCYPKFVHNKVCGDYIFVLYIEITNPTNYYYAMPLESFARKINKDKYPNSNLDFTFEEIDDFNMDSYLVESK